MPAETVHTTCGRDSISIPTNVSRQDFATAKLADETATGMVVFYNTFVAMKHQDSREIPHENLLDHLELRCDGGEYEIFGGAIKHGELRHALRLFKDRSSGVVRLEASALRGPMRDVPLWTAFVTRYVGDPDWALYEPGGLVSLAAVRPRLYVFLSGYGPPHRGRDEYLLDFVTSEGKKLLFASSLYPSQQLTPSKMLGNSLNHGPDFVDSHRHTDEGLVVSASVIPFSAALARIPRSLLEILYASLQMYLQTTFPVRQIREHMTKLKSLKRKFLDLLDYNLWHLNSHRLFIVSASTRLGKVIVALQHLLSNALPGYSNGIPEILFLNLYLRGPSYQSPSRSALRHATHAYYFCPGIPFGSSHKTVEIGCRNRNLPERNL